MIAALKTLDGRVEETNDRVAAAQIAINRVERSAMVDRVSSFHQAAFLLI